MPKNILLVNPKIPEDTYWSFHNSLKFIGKKSAMPPLGLITVAGMLDGYNLQLVDENVETLYDKHLEWADMVFATSMFIQIESLDAVVSRAKQFNKVVVAGGAYPTQFYDKINDVDHFVLGEAETGVLEEFLHDFERGKAKKAYARFVLRKDETGNRIDRSEFQRMAGYFNRDGNIQVIDSRPDLDTSPVPRYDLLRIGDYELMATQLSRGCPHHCEFCNEPSLFGHKPRLKSADRFIEELAVIYNLGHRGPVFVVDDNFIGSIKKVRQVLPAIEKFQRQRSYPFSLSAEASINLSNDDGLMRAMSDAGFNTVFVGIESPDDDVLKKAGKQINIKTDLLEGVRRIQKHGIEVTAGIIVGLDGEPDDICDKIFTFSKEAGIPTAMAGLLTPVIGSELYARLEKEGRLLEMSTKGSNTHDFNIAFVPDRCRSSSEIREAYKKLLARLYGSNGRNYFERCRKLFDNLVPDENFARKIGLREIRSMGQSLFRQSFSSHGWEYLKFLTYVLRKKRKVFSEAVRLSITGYHLMKITNDALNCET
ncbi:MAG: B12-binding domain-containing radical SAM protein [Nanoarchaeota archaeon]|nr:B12-binding domain-containing radical SAM protein [Nanoarchaeota archaeon]